LGFRIGERRVHPRAQTRKNGRNRRYEIRNLIEYKRAKEIKEKSHRQQNGNEHHQKSQGFVFEKLMQPRIVGLEKHRQKQTQYDGGNGRLDKTEAFERAPPDYGDKRGDYDNRQRRDASCNSFVLRI
jgi:hypothetical protein